MITNPLRTDLECATGSTYDDDGFLSVGVDGEAKAAQLPQSEAQHPLGLISRPLDPETNGDGAINQGGACTVLRLSDGNDDHVVVLSDPRVTPSLPRIPKGSTLLYGPTGSDDPPRMLLGDTGESITIHVGAMAKVTIEVEGGPVIIIDNTTVQLGGPGGAPVVKDPGSLATFFASVATALGNLGQPVAPPTGYTCTKVTGT